MRHIRSIVVIALAAGLMWSCGGERVTQSEIGTEEQVGRPLNKLVAQEDAVQATIGVTVHQDGTPVSGATVEFSRSIAGQTPAYEWSGTTDEKGQTLVEIASGNGYYQARASQDGVEIGSWSSIPINAGYKVILYLPIGGKAQVKGSYSLEEPTKQITARDVVDKKTLKAFVEAAKEYAKNFPLSEDIEAEFRQEGGRWKHEAIYLVIGNSDGVILFHAANPALEGQNVFHLEDPNGVKYTQELIAASAAGGGFVEYYFDNPTIDENGDGELVGDPIGSPKISYAIPFIDSVTGMELTMLSGFYPVTARAVIDKETLKSFVGAAKEYAKSFPFSEDIAEEFRQEGGRWKHEAIYLAVLNSEGVIVYHAANADLEGQNLINFEDPNGVKYVQELIAAAAAGGGFVAYYFDNPAVDENGDGELTGDPIGSPKISYAIPITDSQTGRELTFLSGFYPQVKE
ncbi:MAG: hypothetical protein F4Y79_00770 [Gemmatimonadetes bacterium]|nr:hypothetical protein [Gemmatimonadota bacterium]MYF18741.1 hypothetical protein [Gemmatimonadota bacterium]